MIAFKQKKKQEKTESISQFHFTLWIFEFWIFTQFFETQIFFWEFHKHEQIIVGGCSFLQKNAFSKPFRKKNWNKGVLQQLKA